MWCDGRMNWWRSAVFYHIYPFGYCDVAPAALPADQPAADPAPLAQITDDLSRIAELGCNALYLGPLCESDAHGYDTRDYYTADRRLGTNAAVSDLVATAHERGFRVVLDGVFNHVGRGFGPFQDLLRNRTESPFRDWFVGVDFSGDNRFGDGLSYHGWEGAEELVSLDLENREVTEHLFGAVSQWITQWGIDGLRLDVSYLLPDTFLRELNAYTRALRDDFFVLGEQIHGDYAARMQPDVLHSVTNYICYKGIWSSFNDANLFEIDWSLNEQFGSEGALNGARAAGCETYNFLDNHDVTRIASQLQSDDAIFPALGLLFAMPGIPAIYYGSEYGIAGRIEAGDAALRPPRSVVIAAASREDVSSWIRTLATLRQTLCPLRDGDWRRELITNTALVATRSSDGTVLCAVSASAAEQELTLPERCYGVWQCSFTGHRTTISAAEPTLRLAPWATVIWSRE